MKVLPIDFNHNIRKLLQYYQLMATFDWIPILEGKYMTYYQIGALIFSALDLLGAFIFFLIYLILSNIHKAKINLAPFKNYKSLVFWKQFSFIGIFVQLSFIPLVCSALDVLNLFEGMAGMFITYLICIFLKNGTQNILKERFQTIQMQLMNQSDSSQPFIQNKINQNVYFMSKCFKKSKKLNKSIIIALIISIVLPLFFYKTCISFYNDQIGYTSNFFGPAINTYWARLLELKQSCPIGAPCHVYVTIPEDPTTAFFLNVHTYPSITDNVTIFYQQLHTTTPDLFLSQMATSYDYNELEWLSSRKIHSVLINNLKPNTKYLLKVHYDNQFYTNAIYKTLPADSNTPVRMINAGDSGYTHASHNLSKIAAAYKPDIFFMGGDVAYDNNIPACSYTWDFFLNMIQDLSNEVGYIIPLVLTVGNHDVGINQLSGINITLDSTAFFKYFPQQFNRNKQGNIIPGVPSVNDRRSFLHFQFSNVEYVVLDSGYLHGFDGIQKQFIKQTFKNSQKRIKFVNYHVPIYSICQRFDKNPERFLYALFHWIPLFDQFKVMTVFENHVHSFKRTKPLKSNQPAENGTVYVGDGAYGAVLAMTCKPDATMNIFDVFKNKNNFWLSEIRLNQVHHLAYESHGGILDQFTQQTNAYV